MDKIVVDKTAWVCGYPFHLVHVSRVNNLLHCDTGGSVCMVYVMTFAMLASGFVDTRLAVTLSVQTFVWRHSPAGHTGRGVENNGLVPRDLTPAENFLT